jgi:hypothetical protein
MEIQFCHKEEKKHKESESDPLVPHKKPEGKGFSENSLKKEKNHMTTIEGRDRKEVEDCQLDAEKDKIQEPSVPSLLILSRKDSLSDRDRTTQLFNPLAVSDEVVKGGEGHRKNLNNPLRSHNNRLRKRIGMVDLLFPPFNSDEILIPLRIEPRGDEYLVLLSISLKDNAKGFGWGWVRFQ